ncbi:MAG: spore coat protein CotJB [Lachnospiraceae bacterium]|nr:spore coat protein CotJB [Lachnospiraceae bacterium]
MNSNGCMTKEQLLARINQCSFAVNDITLYLDGHPEDENALSYFEEHLERRRELLKLYARNYGPLTIDTAQDDASRSFSWVLTPWPWELRKGGCC